MVDDNLLTYLETFISEERKARFIQILKKRTKYITVALEDVYQMHNTSAVLRSCDVFGLQETHVVENKYGRKLDKNIAMGAEQWVDVHRYNTTEECLQTLKKRKYKIIATTPHSDRTVLSDFKIDDKIALFFGTEQKGLSENVLRQADEFLKIPMAGFTESLNISVSVAVILHKLTEDLRNSSLAWQLTEREIVEKRLDWTKKSIKSIDAILKRFGEKT